MKRLKDLWEAMWTLPTIEDSVQQEMHKHTKEVEGADTMIRKMRFQKHMALANIEALEAWNHGQARC